MVVSLIRVLVKQFVQHGRRRHRVQQQHQTDQQNGQRRMAEAIQLGIYVLQITCNIANNLPPASVILFDGAARRVERAPPQTGSCASRNADHRLYFMKCGDIKLNDK
jgi:hypothetical protein